MARRSGKPVVLIATSRGQGGGSRALEAWQLGLGEPIPLSSAEHGEGMADLYQAIAPHLNDGAAENRGARQATYIEAERELGEDDEPAEPVLLLPQRPIRVAVMAGPNAGKSTLINHLIGETGC